MSRASRLPLRLRLVAGFSAAMVVVLAAAAGFVYWRVQYALDHGLDADLRAASGTIAPLVVADGLDGAVARERADATGLGWQVLDGDGRVLAHGGPVGGSPLVGARALATVSSAPVTLDVGRLLPVSTSPYRVRVVRTAAASAAGAGAGAGNRSAFLVVAAPRDRRDEALRELLLQLALAGLGALVLTALVGERLAWLALLPVERYRRRAEQIADGAVGVRLEVPAGREDEVTRLGHTLNEMLGALERSVERERRFVDEASHELRTPMTLLSSRVQLARRRPRSVAEHERVLDELGVDVARLADLAERLLAVGSADATARTDEASDAGATAVAVVERWRLAHPDRPEDLLVTTPASVPGGLAPVAVGAVVLEQVLTNLVGNALEHGTAPVEVAVGAPAPGWVGVVVTDGGGGMPPELLATATERFRRAPEARARPGAGLGLALVEALVLGVGGELRLCHAGLHHSTGTTTGAACRHDERMSVTVLLPVHRPFIEDCLPSGA